MIPSMAHKKQMQQNADRLDELEEALAAAEGDRDMQADRAQRAEQQISDLERQREEIAAENEQRYQELQERFANRERQLLEQQATTQRNAATAAEKAAEKISSLEASVAALEAKLDAADAKYLLLEEQAAEEKKLCEMETERASGLAEKLAQSEAEKRGVEALAEAAQRQWEQQLEAQRASTASAREEAQRRLEAAEAQLPPLQKSRDEEALERHRLATELSTSKAQGVAQAERIAMLERQRATEC